MIYLSYVDHHWVYILNISKLNQDAFCEFVDKFKLSLVFSLSMLPLVALFEFKEYVLRIFLFICVYKLYAFIHSQYISFITKSSI